MTTTPKELTSMKLAPRKPSKEEKMYPTMAGESKEEYPYGLRVNLEGEQLKALGMESSPAVGAEVTMHAKGHVVSRTEHQSEGDTDGHKSLGIQITHLSCE